MDAEREGDTTRLERRSCPICGASISAVSYRAARAAQLEHSHCDPAVQMRRLHNASSSERGEHRGRPLFPRRHLQRSEHLLGVGHRPVLQQAARAHEIDRPALELPAALLAHALPHLREDVLERLIGVERAQGVGQRLLDARVGLGVGERVVHRAVGLDLGRTTFQHPEVLAAAERGAGRVAPRPRSRSRRPARRSRAGRAGCDRGRASAVRTLPPCRRSARPAAARRFMLLDTSTRASRRPRPASFRNRRCVNGFPSVIR